MKMNKILSILIGGLFLLASCEDQESLFVASSGPVVSVAMESQVLRSLNYNVDDTSPYPYLSHTEEQVVVHCYFRSNDASQPATYLPLTWKRVKDDYGKNTNQLYLSRQNIEMATGTDLSKGTWYVAGIISSQVSPTGIVNLDASRAVNLTQAKATGNVNLLPPYGFAWTPLVLEAGGAQFASVRVTFKPMATLFSLKITRESTATPYVVRGIELRSPMLSSTGTINPFDGDIKPGALPSVVPGATGVMRTMDVSFDFGQEGTASPVYALWAVGPNADNVQKSPEQLYALIETTNEFGQTYNRRYLLSNKKEVLRRNGYRYTLAPPPIGPQVSTSLSYVTDHNVGLSGFRSSSLSHEISQNGYYSMSEVEGPNNAGYESSPGYSSIWFPVAQNVGYDNEANLLNMRAELLGLVIPPGDYKFNVPLEATQTFEIYNIPSGGSTMGGTAYYKSLGDGVLYGMREMSGNVINKWASLPTAYRYDMIPNPDGDGLALRIMSRRLRDDPAGWTGWEDPKVELENRVANEAYWSLAPHNYVTRIFPAMGAYKDGQLVGQGTDVVFMGRGNNYPGGGYPYLVITVNQEGIKHESFPSDPGYRTGVRLIRSQPGGGNSGAVGD